MIRNTRNISVLTVMATAILMLSLSANAAQILFDFGTPTSNVQTGYTQVTTNGGSNDGTALVGGNISVSYPIGQTLHYRDRGTGQFTDLTNVDLLRDIVYFDGMTTSDVFTFTITALNPLQEYEVFGYAVDMFGTNTNDNRTVSWITNGGSVQHTTDSANENLAYARFQMANMTADASGSATITAQYVSGGASIILWNGFQIAEPIREWDNGGGTNLWDDSNGAENWSGSEWTDDSKAIFPSNLGAPEDYNVTLNNSVSTKDISFAGGTNYTISGDNTLTVDGTITVGAGAIVKIDSTVAGSPAIDVSSGGTLDLKSGTLGTVTVTNGTVSGDLAMTTLNVGAAGIVAPGNSDGTFTVSGTSTWAAGSTYEWEFGDPSIADLVDVGGQLTIPELPGQINLTLIPFDGPIVQGETFTLFTYGSLFAGATELTGTVDLWNGGNGYFNLTYPSKLVLEPGFAITATGSAIQISGFTYIPEPSTMVLAGLGLAGACLRRRRLA